MNKVMPRKIFFALLVDEFLAVVLKRELVVSRVFVLHFSALSVPVSIEELHAIPYGMLTAQREGEAVAVNWRWAFECGNFCIFWGIPVGNSHHVLVDVEVRVLPRIIRESLTILRSKTDKRVVIGALVGVGVAGSAVVEE